MYKSKFYSACAGLAALALSVPAQSATIWSADLGAIDCFTSSDLAGVFTDIDIGGGTIIEVCVPDAAVLFFERDDNVNFSLPANQDLITTSVADGGTDAGSVWITRAHEEGLFNWGTESAFGYSDQLSPEGTLWAFDVTTADLNTDSNTGGTLYANQFVSWIDAIKNAGFKPPTSVGYNMVMYLEEDDIYLDVQMQSWTVGGASEDCFWDHTESVPSPNLCGGFSWVRANGLTSTTAVVTVPVPGAVWLFGSGLLGLVGLARKKAS